MVNLNPSHMYYISIHSTIRCIQCMVDKPGTILTTTLEAAALGEYQEAELHSNSRMKRINRPQLVMSVVNNLSNRMFTDESLLKQVNILYDSEWPTLIPQGYGEIEVRQLCATFRVENDMHHVGGDYLGNRGK